MHRVEHVAPSRSFWNATGGYRALGALAIGLTLAACSEEHARVAGPRDASTAIAEFESGGLTDPLIDPADSYLITQSVTRTTTTIESAEPIVDPATGNEVTLLTLPDVIDSTRFEAGYDASGLVRINETRSSTDSGSRAVRLLIANNIATFYDETGAVVYDTSGAVLMDVLGSTANLVVTSEAVMRDEEISLAPAPGTPTLVASVARSSAAAPSVERRGDRLVKEYRLDDAGAGIVGKRSRQYRRAGDEWVVTDERVETTQSLSGMTFHTVETTVYPTVKWKSNKAADDRRRKLRAAAPVAHDASGPLAPMRTTPSRFNDNTLAAALQQTIAPPTCLQCAEDSGAIDPRLVGGTKPVVNLALMHGAFSDASAWERVAVSMAFNFTVPTRVLPTLNWREDLESQAVQLNNRLLASGATKFLVLGHSNGGLVARRAGQMATVTTAPLVGGVVAISSPHQGLPLALNTQSVVGSVLSTQLQSVITSIGGSCGRREFAWLCEDISDVALTFVPKIVNYAFDATIPMSSQVRPRSQFLRTLNSTPEPFMKYSVEVESQGAWKFVRLLGDWKCNPEDRCSGNHLQNMMESAYEVLRHCGSNELSKLIAPSVAARCRNVRWALNNVNTVYERFTAPGDNSDGIVPAKSQIYPGAALNDRAVLRSAKESHVGELKSETVRDNVRKFTNNYALNAL